MAKMPGLILLLILGGLVLWGLWYLFARSMAWVFDPIVKYLQEKNSDYPTENNVPEEGSGKVVITISSLQKNGSHKEDQIEVDLSKKDGKSDK